MMPKPKKMSDEEEQIPDEECKKTTRHTRVNWSKDPRMKDAVNEYSTKPKADREKMSVFATRKGLPVSTFQKHATSTNKRRKITNGQGRPSIVSRHNTDILLRTIRVDGSNNDGALTNVAVKQLQKLQKGIGLTRARNFIARTLKNKSRDFLNQNIVKSPKRRKSERLNSYPKMEQPAVCRGTKRRKLSSVKMVQMIKGVFPIIPDLESRKLDNSIAIGIKNSYTTGALMPQRFTSTQIEHLVNKCTLHSIDKLFGSDDDTRGVRISRKDNTPYHLWSNTDGSTIQDTPVHADRYPTLLSIIGGTGYKKVYLMNNPDNKASQIHDGIGTVWNKVEESGGNVQWNPKPSETSWYELMEDNEDAGVVLSYTLTKGDALLIPSGCLHGVLTVGVSVMLSISVEDIA